MTTPTIEQQAVEYAERIVIEYANISGRESENRTFVREAAFRILPDLISLVREEALRSVKEKAWSSRRNVDNDGCDDRDTKEVAYDIGHHDALALISSFCSEELNK